MLSHAHRRKTNIAWVALLAVTVLLTTGLAIPINVGSLTEWQPPRARTGAVTKRCHQTESNNRTKPAGAQAENARTLLRLFL